MFCFQDIAEQRELPLYGSGGFRFLWDTKFDSAMVAFLDCLQQFKEAVEQGDSGFSLPYRMERGRIEDSTTGNSFSIRYAICKHLLFATCGVHFIFLNIFFEICC